MEKYTSKHYIFFLLCVTVISIKTYPMMFLSLGGRDSWLLVLFAAILVTFLGYYVINTFIKFNITDINSLFKLSFGSSLGNILLFFFALTLLLNGIESISILSSAIHTTQFIETPIWYCLLFFLIPGIYLLSMGFSSILRLALISIIIMILCISILFFSFIPYQELNYIRPILGNSLNFNFLFAVIYILGYFSSLGVTFPYLKNIEKKDTLKKDYFITMLLVLIISVSSVLSVLGFFNQFRGSNIYYPEFIQAQRIEYGKFFEGGEILVLIQDVLGFMVKYILSIFGIYIIYKEKIKKNLIFFIIISLIVFVGSYYLSRNIFILLTLLEYYTIINIIFILLIPIVASFIYKHRKIKNR